MQEWMQREQNVAGLFSPSTLQTRYFQQLKLDYLRNLVSSIRKNASNDERMTLRILKGEMKDMERSLYPRPIVRLAVNAFRVIKAVVKPKEINSVVQPTEWMMKIDTGGKRKTNEQHVRKSDDTTVKVQKHKTQQTLLLEKKRISSGKGIKPR